MGDTICKPLMGTQDGLLEMRSLGQLLAVASALVWTVIVPSPPSSVPPIGDDFYAVPHQRKFRPRILRPSEAQTQTFLTVPLPVLVAPFCLRLSRAFPPPSPASSRPGAMGTFYTH